MTQKLVVKPKTEVAVKANKTDILTLYGVPAMLDQIVKKEKNDFLNKMGCGAVVLDSLNKLSNSEDFFVEIPRGFREMLKSGKAVFDNSSKNPGGFTPNIRIKGGAGINGQATIVQKTDPQAVTQSLSNLAMMAMVQSVLEKLDVIEGKIEDIKKGQKDDRIGLVIGHFKGFMDLLPTFKTQEELNSAATIAYMNMQSGLGQLHLQIENERKELDYAPTNDLQTIKITLANLFHSEITRLKKCYEDFVYDIQLYNRLVLLADVLLYLKGDTDAISRNHIVMSKYCNQYLNDSFVKNMFFLMRKNTVGITNILNYNKTLDSALEGVFIEDLRIECTKEDVKCLNVE